MEEALKYRSQIYGFCALWIVFHHIINTQGVPGFSHIPFFYPFVRMGSAGVDVFMFLSGYCLCLSFKRDSNIKHFFKKRIVRLLIPYLIVSVPYYLWRNSTKAALGNGAFNALGFLKDITGVSFWAEGMTGSWFVEAIIVFYLIFPILYHIISESKRTAIATLVVTYILIIIAFIAPLPGYDHFAIALTRLPAFLLGIVMANYNCAPQYNQKTLKISVFVLILLIGVFPIKTIQEGLGLPGTCLWLPYIFLVLPVIYLSRWAVERIGGVFLDFWEQSLWKYTWCMSTP